MYNQDPVPENNVPQIIAVQCRLVLADPRNMTRSPVENIGILLSGFPKCCARFVGLPQNPRRNEHLAINALRRILRKPVSVAPTPKCLSLFSLTTHLSHLLLRSQSKSRCDSIPTYPTGTFEFEYPDVSIMPYLRKPIGVKI